MTTPKLASKSLGVLEFLKVAQSQEFLPAIFVLTGADDYLHELVVKKLEGRYLDADFRDFNFRRLDCVRQTSAGEVSGLLSELPTLVEHRLVFLNGIAALGKDANTRLVETWHRDIAPGTVLVASIGGAMKDSSFIPALIKAGTKIDCSLQPKDVERLLAAFSRKLGTTVPGPVLRHLRERVGDHLRALISSLERCIVSLRPGETLNEDRVDQLVPFSAEVAMWKMTSAIGQRNHREALTILDHQLGRGESVGAILGYLHSYVTSLIQIEGMMKELGSPAAVAAALPRKKEFQVKKTVEELRTWSSSDFQGVLDGMLRTDFKSKGGSGGGDSRLLLQMLVLKMCSRRKGRTSR